MDVIMVVDIGGSKYMPGFADLEGRILYQEKRNWVGVDADAVVKQLKEALHTICEKNPELAMRAVAGGLTIPGFADPVTGVWVDSDFLVIQDLPLCKILSKEFGIPFYADNDGNACALAEKYFGSARECSDYLYMTVSTGIGGALYLNRELYYGADWHAGEIGMFVVEENGRPSDTGSVNGIVEMYASGRGMSANYAEASGKTSDQIRHPDGEEISRLALNGDPAALSVLELEGRYLGRILANACALVHLNKIIIGGGIALMFEQFKEPLLKEFYRIHPDYEIDIQATGLGYTGAFLGALAVGIRGLNGFHGGKGAGNKKNNLLRIRIDDTAEADLILDGQELPYDRSLFGSFLAARSIQEHGKSLNRIIKENRSCDGNVLHVIGKSVGKAIAAASVLTDPGEIEITGWCTSAEAFRDSLYSTVVRETYYRGKLPFVIRYNDMEEHKNEQL